jgi:hypothetical protein
MRPPQIFGRVAITQTPGQIAKLSRNFSVITRISFKLRLAQGRRPMRAAPCLRQLRVVRSRKRPG